MNGSAVIFPAKTPAHYARAGELFQAYQTFLGIDLNFQGFVEELKSLPSMYGPPTGTLLLAEIETIVGCVGLRRLDAETCEMKRMFVLPSHTGRGIGKKLVSSLTDAALSLGYARIRLDTIPQLKSALSIYQKFGFIQIPPYRFNPYPEAIFMELQLSPRRGIPADKESVS